MANSELSTTLLRIKTHVLAGEFVFVAVPIAMVLYNTVPGGTVGGGVGGNVGSGVGSGVGKRVGIGVVG